METVQQDTSNKVIQKEVFDEQIKSHFQSLLEEIDRKQQSSYQNTESDNSRYIKFGSDKERKILSFTGNVDKKEKPAKDYETKLDIPGKYVTRFIFECYDVTSTPNSQEANGLPAIWERGPKDARTILYYLSKDVKVLEVVRNGQPHSTSTTYLINPRLN